MASMRGLGSGWDRLQAQRLKRDEIFVAMRLGRYPGTNILQIRSGCTSVKVRKLSRFEHG
jgi:hypothetical protein